MRRCRNHQCAGQVWSRALIGFKLLTALGVFAMLVVLAGAGEVRAEQPLNIQQLMADSGSWQIVSAVDYRTLGGPGGVVQRSAQLTGALRYGLSPRVELNARLQSGSGTDRRGEHGRNDDFSSAAVGVNWQLKPETTWPALLLEGTAQLYSRFASDSAELPGAELSLTAYKSIDPVVLSLSARYRVRRATDVDGRRYDQSYSWQLAPQVNFAVNHRVTLIGALVLHVNEAARVEGVRWGATGESLALRSGLGFRMGARSTLFVSGDVVAEGGTSGVSLQWFQTL